MANEADGTVDSGVSSLISVTCTAPVNIAVIKYWGKRDETLILPINASLSATLDQEQLCAKTTVAASSEFTQDHMWLNGKEESVDAPRLQNVLKEIRRRCRKRKNQSTEFDALFKWHLHICSENNFPTAAGLASSAAGFACLVYSLCKLYGVEGDISDIARQGSGSACRSVYGGFVEWTMGNYNDGSDSVAKQVVPKTYWPEMRVLLLVVSAKKKHVGSTAGMQTSVKTSELLSHRAKTIVPVRIEAMKKAIKDKDFETFAKLTMKDSNEMHACCLDTYPPISYMTDTSRDIIRLIHAINKYSGANRVAYTFDAGPNACLYLLEKDVAMVFSLVSHFFPPADTENFIRGPTPKPYKLGKELLDAIPLDPTADGINYVIHTKVGPGPLNLDVLKHSLLDNKGMPKTLAK